MLFLFLTHDSPKLTGEPKSKFPLASEHVKHNERPCKQTGTNKQTCRKLSEERNFCMRGEGVIVSEKKYFEHWPTFIKQGN